MIRRHFRHKLADLCLHGFSGSFSPKWRFCEQNRGRDGVMLTLNVLVLTFEGCCLCATFGENRSRNATVRVLTADRETDTL